MQGRSPHPKRSLWRRVLLAPLTIAMLVGVVFAVVEPVPLDLILRQAQYILIPKQASGQIVIVDPAPSATDPSLGDERLADARLLDALRRYHPRQVFVERQYFSPSTPAADDALAHALARYEHPVVLAAKFITDGRGQGRESRLPLSELRQHADIASSVVWINPFGYSDYMYYAEETNRRVVPSFASLMAGERGAAGTSFLIDFSTRISTVPHVNAAEILSGRVSSDALAGKTVLIATDSASSEVVRLPRLGISQQTEVHALAAETLLRGRPLNLGGWPLLVLLGLIHWLIVLSCPTLRKANIARVTGFVLLLTAGGVAGLFQVNLDATPAIAGLVTLTWMITWQRRKTRAEQTNLRSNLPNMAGFWAAAPPADAVLVVARVARIDEILTALPAALHGPFARAVVHRLKAGNHELTLYHDDNGHFAWYAPAQSFAAIESHLTGLKALFATPIQLTDHPIDVELAFGIDVNSDQDSSLRLASASNAAAEAAASGRIAHSFDIERLQRASWTTSLHTAIDKALQNQEIWVAYQPKLDLARGRVTGAEALVRWTHPTRGNIPPNDFIGHAERDGRIDALTWAVADHAVASAALLNETGAPFHVAINLSAVMLERTDLHERMMEVLLRHKLRPDLLTLELTETVPLGQDDIVTANLNRLRASGCRVSIDDYGTGASNLLYLKNVPSDEVKIDQAFVTGLTENVANTAIVRGTIDMVHALKRSVVAEGVEDLATLRLLGHLGCDLAQGYAIGRPQQLSEFRQTFRSGLDAKFALVGGNKA